MNKTRRARLERALASVQGAVKAMREAREAISGVRDDEQEALDNLSDAQRDGDLGDAMQGAVSGLDEALDLIDALDTKSIASALEQSCDVSGDGGESGTITAEQAAERRHARLPQWAKDELARSAAGQKAAEAKMLAMFSDPTGDEGEMVVGDYNSPLEGKVLPFKTVLIPAYGLRVSVMKQRGGLSIDGDRQVSIHPQVSNSVVIKGEKW